MRIYNLINLNNSSSSPAIAAFLHVRYLSWLRCVGVLLKVEAEAPSRRRPLPHLPHLLKELLLRKRHPLLLLSFLLIVHGAGALVVVAAALVAEAAAAAALHLFAAVGLLDPELAVGALLEFLAARKLQELLVVPVLPVRDLVLLAGLAPVEGHAAVQAVVLPAHVALEVAHALQEKKHVVAPGRRAP